MANITGTTGSDILTGTPGDDVIDGLGGGDLMAGGAGRDQFVFDLPVGQALETITDFQSGVDQLVLDNLAEGETVTVRLGFLGADSIVDLGLSQAQIILFSVNLQGPDIDVPDGHTLDIRGGPGADVIVAGRFHNGVSGLDNVLIGDTGADTFVYQPGDGNGVIADFSHAQGDRIDLSAYGAFHTLADVLSVAVQSGDNTVIHLPGGGGLTLDGVQAIDLTPADFGLSPQTAATASAPGDLDGDHLSDILLQTATGHWGFYSLNTGFVDAGSGDPNYSIVGTGDFDGNGLADVVFRNNATGQWGYAQSTHGQGSPFVYAGLSDPNLRIEGVADFNGDGIPDVVFRNDATGEWGYAAMSYGAGDPWVYAGLSDPNYALAGIGDFNGDGIPDVLFRNNATGQMGYAAMSHGTGDPWVYIGLSDTHYTVNGVGDFNGDGIPDLVMSDASNGDWGYVAMTHGQGTTWVDVGTLPSGMSIVGVGDYNGDGVSDVLMRDNATGQWGYEAFTHGGMAWQPLPQSDPAFMVVA